MKIFLGPLELCSMIPFRAYFIDFRRSLARDEPLLYSKPCESCHTLSFVTSLVPLLTNLLSLFCFILLCSFYNSRCSLKHTRLSTFRYLNPPATRIYIQPLLSALVLQEGRIISLQQELQSNWRWESVQGCGFPAAWGSCQF